MTETDIYTFLELLENHEVYNFRIIRREIESFEELQEPYEVITPEGFDEIQEPYEVITPEGFDEIQEPYEVIPPEGFDEIHEPYEVIPPEGFDEIQEPYEIAPKTNNLFDNRVYTYYAAYTDYYDPDHSARQRIFKILNLEELISVVTNDIDSLVVRGHLSLFDTNVDSFLEEIFEK